MHFTAFSLQDWRTNHKAAILKGGEYNIEDADRNPMKHGTSILENIEKVEELSELLNGIPNIISINSAFLSSKQKEGN